MSGFLSAVSGQFAKSLLLGMFFPAVLFLLVATAVVLPVAGISPADFYPGLFPWEKESTLLAQSLTVVLLTVLLYFLNIPVIRLYEGYPWEHSWIGGWMKRRQQRRFMRAGSVRRRTRGLRYQIKEAGLDVETDLLGEAQTEMALRLNHFYPERKDLVLPTRLGNVIRSFERYADIQYGMEAIALYPRLLAKVPTDYRSAIDDEKTSFDFMLNCSVLSGAVAVLVSAAGMFRYHPFEWTHGWLWMRWTLTFVVLWQLFYQLAINRARAWGTQVRGAFDLYRLDLLAALGYRREFGSRQEEMAVWKEVGYRILFPDNDNLPDIPYATDSSWVRAVPASVIVSSSKSVELAADSITVTITVTNVDRLRNQASNVVIYETIPKKHTLIAGSFNPANVKVSGLDPLKVNLGPLAAGPPATFSYKLKRPQP